MKRLMIACVTAVLLAGCDYNVPLVTSPAVPLDPGLIGLWERPGDDQKVERLLVLPLDANQYLVVYPAESDHTMYARGSLWRNGDATLVQLDWFGTSKGDVPDDRRTFQYAAYTAGADALEVRLLNVDVVSRDVETSGELSKAIADHAGDPKLFRDAMSFQRVKH